MNIHKHHIIPKYRCKELWPEIYQGLVPGYKIDNIEFYFKENVLEVDRLGHARIHWGYNCDDLEPLFEYIRPAQWIIDLIPRGDGRDVAAAVFLGRNEIDGIEPAKGKNNPAYKHGRAVNLRNDPKARSLYMKERYRSPEYIKRYKTPEYTDKRKEKERERNQTPERKKYNREYQRKYKILNPQKMKEIDERKRERKRERKHAEEEELKKIKNRRVRKESITSKARAERLAARAERLAKRRENRIKRAAEKQANSSTLDEFLA